MFPNQNGKMIIQYKDSVRLTERTGVTGLPQDVGPANPL